MDFPQEEDDAVGGNQTGRAACAVSSPMSMKNEEPVTDGHQGVSTGRVLSYQRPQTHRPVSPVPSCVSMKSDWSMGHPYNFRSGPSQSDLKPQTDRPVSPVPSCVSMKSDWSMGHPYNFSSGPSQSDQKPQTHRPVSPVPSCVSMQSDWSMGHPYNFSSGPPQSNPKDILAQDQFRCGVCEQLLRDPVITSCGHSFCRQCISSYWSQSGPSRDYSCPQCRKRSRTQPITNSDITMAQLLQTRIQPLLYPPTPMAQSHLYPPTSMAQPLLYSPTGIVQPLSYQHSEMALHLNPSANMAQVPPNPHTDTGQRPQYSNSDMGQHNHYPHIQHPLYPHIHTAQISPQPPLDEHTVMRGSTHLQTEHAPVKRAKLTDDLVLNRVLMTHRASMKRKFESICEGIIRSGTQTLLNKIYTELYITEGESEGVNNEHEVWQVESASRPQTTEDTAINCNDIFKPLPGQERHIRTVMTKGIAGIGKTISVQKFILDWAEERANQDVDFMFVLPFRELNLVKHNQYSLHRLLLDFHPELRELQDGEYKDCHIVFIFDGLDESRLPLNFQKNQKLSDVTQTSSVDVLMTSLIQGTLLPSALIWITSRPAATSQIPSQCISLVTEVRGFNDPQKEEYFRKRISDQNQANRIISHIKESRSLHIMCHMPVFCWISATVLQQILEQDDGKEAPKTLTEMFIHFMLIQTTRKNQKYQEESETDRQRLLESHKGVILKLAELAFKHLENGNLMFYEEDLRECGIDVSEASVYSGMCTEIFREECVFDHKKVYCFVHLSIQEFLSAMFVFHSYISGHLEALKLFLSEKNRNLKAFLPLHVLLKSAMDKALGSKNGHLDLFLRFLVGISVESNQTLLTGLLTNTHSSSESIKKTCLYIKRLRRDDLSPERCINLFHCLFEMNDHSVHEKIQKYLKSPKGLSDGLTPAHCSALAHMLLMSEEVLDEFDLSKYKTSDEGRRRLVPAVRCCRKALLADCKLTEKSCEIVASALQSANSPLRELDLSQNDLQKSGEKLANALLSPNCKLETLRLADCKLTEKSSEIVASALQSANSPLRELDLSQNDLQKSGEKLANALLGPNCKLETLRLVGCKLRGRFLALAHKGANSNLRELDMSDSELEDCGGELLHQPLNQDCKVRLTRCKLKHSFSEVVVSVMQSYISQLSELDMSGCDLRTSEEKLLSDLRSPNCQLEKLRLVDCKLRGRFLALILQWGNSHLRELDISDCELQDCGGELLHQPLNQDCKVRLTRCKLKHSSCEAVVSVLQSYHSHLGEVDMSGCDLQTSEEKLLSGLRNPNCHLVKLRLVDCKLRGRFLALTLQWANSHLRELDISDCELQDCGGELLHQSLNQDCKVRLISCRLKHCSSEVVVSVLQSYISQLSELDMSGCDLQTSEEKLLSGLRNPNCHLKKLRLVGCKLRGRFLALTLQWANSHLRELDISDSELQDCEGELHHQPLNQDCKVRLISCRLKDSSSEVVVSVLQSYISQLSELDMSGCDLQTSEEKLLSGFRNPNCHLEKLRLVGCKLRGRFLALILQWANSHLRELDISDSELQDCEVELLHQPLNQDCKVRLTSCRLKDSSSEVVVSVLQSYISQLSELDMSGCDLQTSEEKLLSGFRNPNCHLEKLRLVGCKLRGRFLALILQWANPHLRELDISDCELQDCEGELLHQPLNQDCKVRLISWRLKHSSREVVVSVLSYISQLSELDMSGCDLQTSEEKLLSGLRNSNCHLETLRLADCKLTEESCKAVASALQSSISIDELDLSHNDLKDSRVQLLSTGLISPHCKLTSLRLAGCKLTEESCTAVASALQSSISLKELDLSDNDLKESGVQLLSTGLSSPHCKLTSLRLNLCHLSKASCEMMASVLQRTPSHLRELDMSDNDLQDEGVELLCVGLRDPQCKLETLRLSGCLITHEGCSLLSSALKSNASYLKHLDLGYNHPGDSGVRELTDRLNDPSCKLETLRYDHGGECRIKPGLRKYACELTLDPNTAHRELSLSEGNRKVTRGSEEQPYPDHPERFDSYCYQVLCREGQSGRCYWEAEWSDYVYIAVAYKSMQRKGESSSSSEFGRNAESWSLSCSSNSYSALHNDKHTAIPAPSSRSSRVGVYLDWPAGTLSFYSVSSHTLTHLHTFHSTFTEPLYPGFRVYSGSSVSLCQIT
ncbi:uncharacterized protein LOC143126619 isoform X3 [Alosa pseudoharengus]|uniref:uncharacterized protein LOC143126619 isoform X3 n=1 Tax=Alosa pseudoharengus TaxID=34774 RepID=UPI003F8A0214